MLLLEKAFAKLHGNYSLLKDGVSYEALIDLTGAPTQTIDFEDPRNAEKMKSGSLFDSFVSA